MIDDLKPYPEYKDSGLPWLGKVPKGWEVRQARQIGRLLKGVGGTKEDSVPAGVPCVRYGELYTTFTYFIRSNKAFVRPERARHYTPIHYGDVLFAASGETLEDIGKSAVNLMKSPACCGGDIIILRPSIPVHAPFLGYAMDCRPAAVQKATMGRGTTVKHVYPDELRLLLVPLPPPEEQAAIVRFLDHANARIERAIRAKRKLIALLNEQKQAIIHRAVTRGLDPAVKLKPSGIPWLGDVPGHWEVRPLKQLLTRMDYGTSENARGEGRIRVLGMGHIRDGRITLPTTGGLSEVPSGLLLERHDLLFNRTNSPDLVGKVGLFEGFASDEVTFASYLVRLRLKAGYDPFWLNYLLNSFRFWGFARSQALVSLHQANLNPKRYGQMAIPVPPGNEQPLIIELIRTHVGGIEAVIARTEREIELLREYRTTLTAEVVTGKLDVREAAKRLPAEAEEPLPADELADDEDIPEEAA